MDVKRIRHVGVSVEGLKRLSDRELKCLARFYYVNGNPLETAEQVRRALQEAEQRGLEYIPSKECDHYDSKGRCLCHEKN